MTPSARPALRLAGVRTASALAAAAALLIGGLCGATAVQAGPSTSIDPKRLMVADDIPRILGRFPAVGISEPVDPIITACQDAGYRLVSVPAPQRLTSVTTNASTARIYRSVTEDVFRFDSSAAATTSFTGLVATAAGCAGTTSRTDDSGATTGVRLATGRVPAGAASPGAPVWTQQQTVTAAPRGDRARVDHRDVLYRVFTRAEDAIIVTTYFVNGAAAISPGRAAAVQRLAVANAARYASRR